jgi:hypothetical protein
MAGARSLSADDKSIAACRVRGFTISHCDWILASRQRAALRGRWLALFEDVDVSRTITRRSRRANSILMGRRDRISTSSPGLAPPPSMACPRRQGRSDGLMPDCRSVSRSLAVSSTTARRSPSRTWSSASSAASRRPQCCNRPTRRGRPGATAAAAGVDWTGAHAARRRRARGGLTPSAALRVYQALQIRTRRCTTTRSRRHLTNSCRHPARSIFGTTVVDRYGANLEV